MPPTDHRHARVDHYENFPVASWLCPPRLRPPIAAIYRFARTADDIADEGDAPAETRLSELDAYRSDLKAAFAGTTDSGRWPAVFGPLRRAIADFQLPFQPLADLLDAFAQDVAKTRAGAGYLDRRELLAYCRRSADPVGRLLLHLYLVRDDSLLAMSDAVCSALQLINFWQDLSVDIPRGRYYVPTEDALRHGLDPAHPERWGEDARAREMVAELCDWARAIMLRGAPLAKRIPGRAGWELRLVVQGGLRILDRIAAGGFDTLHVRPKLRARDMPVLLWRTLRM
ncbi:squalene synthase HpnC [Ramlibacter sp. XY19]|uniref:squalene synthase HpnC n=1 Tax=Ramlibacter paludis TaxID=2908000 RepID=UPI0023DC419F|nr:squalene synthase HpnC [Ramlibacter paludis]MCG2592814.1 squalene synthase HpnC [Ramlibacter paludis]